MDKHVLISFSIFHFFCHFFPPGIHKLWLYCWRALPCFIITESFCPEPAPVVLRVKCTFEAVTIWIFLFHAITVKSQNESGAQCLLNATRSTYRVHGNITSDHAKPKPQLLFKMYICVVATTFILQASKERIQCSKTTTVAIWATLRGENRKGSTICQNVYRKMFFCWQHSFVRGISTSCVAVTYINNLHLTC